MTEQEYCIISDGDSHLYVCPADRVQEAQDTFAAIVKYWRECDYDKECPQDPDFVQAIGGSPSLVKFKEFRIDL